VCKNEIQLKERFFQKIKKVRFISLKRYHSLLVSIQSLDYISLHFHVKTNKTEKHHIQEEDCKKLGNKYPKEKEKKKSNWELTLRKIITTAMVEN
jgi:CRISPR/Cas system CSM-associated protein Csm4 (group 5 of RAMP superfamily)